MTHKAWIKAVAAHEDTGRVPYNYSFSPPAAQRLRKHYVVESLPDHLDIPFRMIGLNSPKPMYANPDECGPTVADEFGVVWATTHIDRGVPLEHPLTEPDLSGFTFPDPHDPARWAGVAEYLDKYKDYYTGVRTGELWERATFLRGLEELLCDLVENRPFVEELLERQTEYLLQVMAHALALGDFDCFYLSDDYGAQRSLLMSPADWRELIKPRLARLYAFAKANGRQTYLHSCGCIEEVIPDLIEIGLDMLHPIQPETMDIYRLKREFGRDITFCGGLRTQDLLPLGTPDEIRAEVRKLKRIMGAGGGYVLEPGITIQDDVPLENMVVLVEEAMVVD
jgi:uroporphyrinogen decarboxylase